MKIKSILAVALAAAVAFASCSKENETPTVTSKQGNFYVKITTPDATTRAIGEDSNGAKLSLEGGKIMWSDMHGTITRVVSVASAADYAAASDEAKKDLVNVTALAAGTTISDVMEDSKVCTFIGKHTATSGMPSELKGAKIDAVKAAYFSVNSMLDATAGTVSNVPIFGDDADLQVDKTTDPDNPVIKADFQVKAIGSRIQINSIKGGESVQSFKIAGIWVNNFFTKMPYSQTLLVADLKNFKDVTADYNAAYDGYAGALADVETAAGVGIGHKVSDKEFVAKEREGTKDFYWSYNVFPNNGFGRTELPHVIIKLTDLTDKNGKNHGEMWLTVKGYVKSNQTSLDNFLPGYVYTFGGTKGLTFEVDDSKEKPEMGEVTGNVTITTMDWAGELVTPEF